MVVNKNYGALMSSFSLLTFCVIVGSHPKVMTILNYYRKIYYRKGGDPMAIVAGKTSYPKTTKKSLDELLSSKKKEQQPDNEETQEPTNDEISFEELRGLFGAGFAEIEYREMYRKFISLQNNYPLRTEMHKEALVTYVKYAFKRDKAIADDDMDAADKWGKLCAKQATDAKINPSQLSAADLSDGMTCFSQVSAAVERAQDIIPLLNKFIERPQDRVDYTIWQYVNYCRHLEGKPLIQYRELYTFLKKRYEENKEKLSFIYDEGDGLFDERDLGE